MIGTVYQSEQELLKAIIKIHCPFGFYLDPMYFKGNFYKNIPEPVFRGDITPIADYVFNIDATNLKGFENNSIPDMILDPPFLFEIRNRKNSNYGANTHGILKGYSELENLYKSILKEAHRVLKLKGILVFKCQDFTDSKTTMTHCLVYNWAVGQGFYAKDLAILWLPKNKIYNSKLTQRHLRKTHSYFWIFQKIIK
jgi:hypothetical protein